MNSMHKTALFASFFTWSLFGPFYSMGQYEPACDSNALVKHHFYTLCYHEKTEQASWVFYFLTPERVSNKVASRSDHFYSDPWVTSGSAHPSDYKNSGYDRGHLCPAGDMTFDSLAMRESFYMSNICPQFPGFNRGIWKTLEEYVREWALRFDSLFVCTGPLFYDTSYSFIGANKVAVPDACYKIVLGRRDSAWVAMAFIIPNLNGLSDPFRFSMSVDEAEMTCGIDFFPALNDSTEISIETDTLFRAFLP